MEPVKAFDNTRFLWSFLLSIGGYIFLSYYTERHETELVLGIYILLFLNFYRFYSLSDVIGFERLITTGLVFRVVLLASVPNLSDDFYRFIWDGRLLNLGVDPFAHIPAYYLKEGNELPGLDLALFEKLNSPEYFTVYPPLNQFIFWLAAWLFPSSVYWSMIVMKLFVVTSDIGNVYLMKSLSKRLNLNQKNILLYALNPLVILECSGNLHFEVVMLFFLLLAILLWIRGDLWKSAMAFSFSITTKLIPLMLLPAFLTRTKFHKVAFFYLLVGITTVVLTLPILSSELISGMQESLGLYFTQFEFNASIYYLVRGLGYWFTGYNMIGVIGKILPVITLLLILIISWIRPLKQIDLITVFLFILTIYYLFSSIVHPWYIVTLAGLSVLTSFRYPILWSLAIFFTYIGYSKTGFKENYWVILIEYVVVFGFLIYELVFMNKHTGYDTA